MGFNDCDRMASRNFFVLSGDGETGDIVFLAEPEIKKGEFKGRPKIGFVFPVLHENEVKVWEVGQTLYKTLRDGWDKYHRNAFTITRIGKKGDTNTKYNLKSCKLSSDSKECLESIDDIQIEAVLMSATGIEL